MSITASNVNAGACRGRVGRYRKALWKIGKRCYTCFTLFTCHTVHTLLRHWPARLEEPISCWKPGVTFSVLWLNSCFMCVNAFCLAQRGCFCLATSDLAVCTHEPAESCLKSVAQWHRSHSPRCTSAAPHFFSFNFKWSAARWHGGGVHARVCTRV